MKLFAGAALIAATMGSMPAVAGDVGISVNIGAPGFYGRIDIGNVPQPQLVYAAPVVVAQPAVPLLVAPAPIYVHVPPGHEKHWRKHCREYNACGVPVYFVRDTWYNTVYVDHYRREAQDHGRGDDGHHGDRGDHGDHGDHRHHGDHGDRGHDRND